MNGYPEWIPASETPKERGGYVVSRANGSVGIGFWSERRNRFENLENDEPADVIAWMLKPPAYDPPKFGWHPCEEKPPKPGKYLVLFCASWDAKQHYGILDFYEIGIWECPYGATLIWWSHIEPVPGGDPRG